ncbi:pentapeptide repeat-containing protein, partial [Paraburkholderia sediminicola]|uniref:pentapeptide repeat-containing protein n=1 Tax=Paraburkholderia sediminicola TaxID=458836 RepID=UPI0038B8E5B3
RDLSGLDLSGTDLRGANLQDANLEGANLRGANLIYADLQNVNLLNVNLNGVNLEGANLNGAYLFRVSPDCVTSFCGTPEGGMSLISLTYRRNLKDVRPEIWRRLDFDLLFNHRNNDGRSVLYDIEHLAEGCRAKKQMLMRSVAGELDMLRQGAPEALAELIPSFGDVLFLDPAYLQGHDAFAIWLLDGLLGDGTILLDGRLGDTALQALGVYAGRLLEADGMAVVTGRSAAI